MPAVDPSPAEHVNLNAPTYISPSISFDPVTNIVFLTFRNAETGKVTQQIPPSEILSRYRSVDETGVPDPSLPHTTPVALVELGSGGPKAPKQPPDTPADNTPQNLA